MFDLHTKPEKLRYATFKKNKFYFVDHHQSNKQINIIIQKQIRLTIAYGAIRGIFRKGR